MMLFSRSASASATAASAIDCFSKESRSFAPVASKIRLLSQLVVQRACDHVERLEHHVGRK